MADAEQLAVALAEQPRELDAIAEHIDNDDVTSLAMALDPQPSWVRTEAAARYRHDMDAAFAAWQEPEIDVPPSSVQVPSHPLGEYLIDACYEGRSACGE